VAATRLRVEASRRILLFIPPVLVPRCSFPGIHSSGVRGYGAVRGGVAGRGAGINLRIGNSFYPRRGVYGRRSHSSYAPYYPYGYYGWYADPLYDTNDQDTYADEYRPAPAQDDEDSGVRQDLDALNGKVDRLQQDVEARNRPKDTEPETALVFRDRHVEEVRNYAISNGTLWVLNAPAAKKIPLDQLDLAATVKMNDDRGVDFQVPGPSLSIMLMRLDGPRKLHRFLSLRDFLQPVE